MGAHRDRQPIPEHRVAHVVRSYGVPSQTFVADTVVSLEHLGWEAWVVARSVERRDWFPFPPDERLLLGNRPRLGRRAAQRAFFASGAERRAAWWHHALAQARPELVHAHFGWAGVDALPLARRGGLPLLVTFHGTDLTVYPDGGRGRREYAALLPRLDHAIVVSSFLGQKLRALGYRGDMDVIPTGLRLDEMALRPAPPPGPPWRLLFVGRQVPVKGLDVLLRALPGLCARHPDLCLEVIGDGPEHSGNESLARRLGVGHHVTFAGAQPREQVRQAMERAHVLVVPSRTSADGAAEGAGLVPKEAMALGLPVVATANGGLPETIAPAFHEELVEEGNPAALGAAVDALLERSASWPQRAQIARDWVAERFDEERIARRIARVYEQLADKPALSRPGEPLAVAGRR